MDPFLFLSSAKASAIGQIMVMWCKILDIHATCRAGHEQLFMPSVYAERDDNSCLCQVFMLRETKAAVYAECDENSCFLYSRKFSSAKNFVKSDPDSSSGIYFYQTSVVARLFFGRSVVALLLIIHFHIHKYFWSHTRGCEKNSQEFNGIYSLKWRLTDRYLKWGTLAHPRPGRAGPRPISANRVNFCMNCTSRVSRAFECPPLACTRNYYE